MRKEDFFNRSGYLDMLTKRVSGLKDGYRQNMAIVGEELVGKTSLLFRFLDTFTDNRILVMYIEVRAETLASFAKRFIGILLYNFLSPCENDLEENISFLLNKSEKYIPRTVCKIRAILHALEQRKKNALFTELLSLTETFYQETTKSCVIIFDEFQHLERLGVRNLYREWAKLLMTQKNTMYIIASSMVFKTKTVLAKQLSLLFGNFEIITLQPFDIKTSSAYLEHTLKGHPLNPGYKEFLVSFSGGYPFYLKIITEELRRNEKRSLVDILEHLLFDYSGALHQRFTHYVKRILDHTYGHDHLAALYLIAQGRNKIKDVTLLLRKTAAQMNSRINHILETDIILKNGDFLKMNDRVFGFWLRYVYQEKSNSLTFDAKNQKEKFRDYIEAAIRDFLYHSQRPITERLNELLEAFADDTIQVDKKKVKLSHFREIKPLEFRSNCVPCGLLGRSRESLWIIGFKKERLNEEDISLFAQECKRYHHKIQRKIIVTLHDIDMNTRLRALDEKIWAWDVNNLNQILDLFSHARVVA
ncbi:MAG: ATP-binding protein [Candidatus Omnitrophica bacterium]|nr:ATP-binding protein [Candidatus Omnitrophota bacterium]